METCNEMIKLRKWLDDNKITWIDASEDDGTRGGTIPFLDVSHSF